MTLLCISTYCGLPGRHVDDCETPEDCRGCLPALAADSLRLCRVCADRIPDDALWAATLHEAMIDRLASPARGGEPVAGNDIDPGLDVPPELVEARTAIWATLTGICLTAARERGITPPGPDAMEMALYISANAEWLAAHRHADRPAGQLRDLRLDPRTWRIAYPARTQRLYLGDCPLERDGQPCATRLTVTAGQASLRCPGCDAEGTVEQWRKAITGDEVQAVVDAYAAAARLSTLYGREVQPGLVRKWGQRRKVIIITTRTTQQWRDDSQEVALRDRTGRTLYEWTSILARATTSWGTPT